MKCITALKRPVIITCFAVIVGSVLIDTGFSAVNELLPNGALRVSYRQLQEGKLSESVHNAELLCLDGQCSLTTLTLNQCRLFDQHEKVFMPKIERTSTREGNLSVIVIDKGTILAEENDSEATYKYRFTYKDRSEPQFSKAVGIRTTLWFKELTGFSGGAIKQSPTLGKVISWELVPLKWVNNAPPIIEVACKILLNGVRE
jgi:hypothetical protein